MNIVKTLGILIVVIAVVVVKQRVFLSIPQMSRAADAITVGDPQGDHARFTIGQRDSFSAANVGYDIGYLGGGPLSELGSRAVISYVDKGLYASSAAASRCNGVCMAGPLNAAEQQGRMGHLLLIPADDAALASMKRAKLTSGSPFRLSGWRLSYQSGKLDGHPFDGRIGNTGYFLVASIELE